MDKDLPVDMIIVENTAINGKHYEAGHVVKDCDPGLAMDLASSGKARPATKDLIDEAKKRAQVKKEAEENAKKLLETNAATALAGSEAMAAIIGQAVAQGVQLAVDKITAETPAAAS